jgi:cell division protein FtsI/penicillin-binding protein 2
MIILCFIAFLVAVVIIAVAIVKIQGSKFNTKVQAYSERHTHKVLVNYVYNFIAIDVNSQELTYISPGKQITFTRSQIADVKIVEKIAPSSSDPYPGEPDEYKVNVVITLENSGVKAIKINCVHSAPKGSFLYNSGYDSARAIEDALVKVKNGII